MKKSFLFMTLAGLALVGCTNDESFSEKVENQKIRFDAPLMSKVTKAVQGEIEGAIYPVGESFSVYAIQYANSFKGWSASEVVKNFWDGGNTLTTEVATHTGTATGAGATWETTNTYYWVNSPYALAFMAYSPSSVAPATVTAGNKGLTITGFKVDNDVSKHYDLMYSDRIYDCTRKKYENTGIPLNFNHALSSIVFAAIEQVADKRYEITGISLSGPLMNKGNFCTNITENTSADPYTETTAPEWENLTIEADGDTVKYTPAITVTGTNGYEVTGTNDEFTGGQTAILALPQDLSSCIDKLHVILEYDVYTTQSGGEKKDSYTKVIHLQDFIVAGSVSDKITEWLPGKRYVYTINFGGSKKIFFVPTVTPWEAGGTSVFTI